MTNYRAKAAAMKQYAPAQARVLGHILDHPGQTTPQILRALDMKDANFRRIIGRLRDLGVEVIVTRVPIDPDNKTDADYRWSIKSGEEMENWAGTRKSAVMTSWHRVQRMMDTHLSNIETLNERDRGRILDRLEIITDLIVRVDLRIVEAQRAAVAEREEAEAELIGTTED